MNKRTSFVASATFLAIVAHLAAAPAIPPTSTIAAKINMARAQSLPAASQAIDCLLAEVPDIRTAVKMISQSFGVDVRKDVSTVIAFSDGFSYNDGRVSLKDASSLASGKFDTARMSAAVKKAPGFTSVNASGLEAMTADFSKGRWVAFPSGNTVLASSTKSAITKAAAALAAGSDASQGFLAKSIDADCAAVVAIDGSKGAPNLTTLTSGLLKADARSIVAKITEPTPGTARLDVDMVFDNETLAAQTFATINGIKMLTALRQAQDPSAPSLLQRLVEADVNCSGSKVHFAMTASAKDLSSLKL